MFKKLILVGLTLAICLPLVIGCETPVSVVNPGDDYEVNIDLTDEDYNQTATIKVGVTADPYESDLIVAVRDGFKQLFPNVTIEIMRLAGQDYASAVSQRFRGGDMPDIFYTSENESFTFISSGLYLNLKPYINAQKAADAKYEEQFVPEAWKMGQENYDGAQFFVPRSSDRIVTHLNMKYIKPALESESRPDKSVTLDTVSNGWTWDDFLKVCEALRVYYDSNGWTAGSGRYLVDHSMTWAPVMFSVFNSMGTEFYQNGEINIDSAQAKETVALMRNLVEKKYIAPNNAGGANYENGNGSMLFHSSSAIAKYSGFIGDDYEIVTFPVINGESGVTGYGVPGYGIYAGIDGSKRDLAWQLLSYIISQDGQQRLATAGMKTPSVRVDLGDYNTANWGEGYRHLNLEATVYQPERNYSETFFLNYPAGKKNDLVGVVSQFVENALTYNVSTMQPSFTVETCISTAKTNFGKVLAK